MSVIDVPKQEPPPESRVEAYRRGRSTRVWHWTAGTGMALVVLATMHIVAQHFIVHQKGGLRTYGEVLSYIGNPSSSCSRQPSWSRSRFTRCWGCGACWETST